jgi:hypothetical protein
MAQSLKIFKKETSKTQEPETPTVEAKEGEKKQD